MPTEFSDCDECNHLYWFDLEHKFNKEYKQDLEIYSALVESGFPEIVALNIVKQMYILKPCNYCNAPNKTNILCEDHYQRAQKNGKHYRGSEGKAMCDRCCWWEI